MAVSAHRGYAAVPLAVMRGLGWTVEETEAGWALGHGSTRVTLQANTPFFRWDGAGLQLADEPYLFGEGLHVPLQLLTDFLPAHLPGAYAWDGRGAGTLTVLDPSHWSDGAVAARGSAPGASPMARPSPVALEPRVVVIDPGHGGRDWGATGPGGVREKDVALAIGTALAEELRRYPGLEVHITRDTDVLVPLWKRGERATGLKGARPGVFISIHANAMPAGRAGRGFETYFLSEARDEHERRVAALENAPLSLEGEADAAVAPDPDLDFILKELRTYDHQHWSELLGSMVQDRMGEVHPGPDRGVKQAPLAVITNALMPAVLVEVGFLTNREEERLLARPSFHAEAASAMARAVVDFFQRYPPGRGTDLSRASGSVGPAGG